MQHFITGQEPQAQELVQEFEEQVVTALPHWGAAPSVQSKPDFL